MGRNCGVKKWYLLVVLGSTVCPSFPSEFSELDSASDLQASKEKESQKKATCEQFACNLQKYTIEPGWVIRSLLALPLEEFDKVWELLIVTIRETPWKFFVGKQQNYSEKKYRELFIAHCELYDDFLRNLLVDLQQKRIIFAAGPEKTHLLKRKGVITIFQYWQLKRVTLHHHFYAFYFDRVVMQLYETVITASCQLDMPDYPLLYKQARKYGTRLSSIFKQLKGGPYDDRYAYHVKRYQEILELLRKERKALVGGADAETR